MLCNVGAAELLMPTGSLTGMQNRSLPINEVMELRRRFEVSTESILLRLIRVTNEPCILFAASRINPDQPFVVGVGRAPPDDHRLDEYAKALSTRGIVAPVFGVDVRNREDVLLLVETLLCVLEAQNFEADHADH